MILNTINLIRVLKAFLLPVNKRLRVVDLLRTKSLVEFFFIIEVLAITSIEQARRTRA